MFRDVPERAVLKVGRGFWDGEAEKRVRGRWTQGREIWDAGK